MTFGNTAAGRAHFEANCAIYHKADGSSGIKFGNEASADLTAPALEYLYHDAELANAILNGKDQNGADLAAIIPRWHEELNAAQVADIIAYLKNIEIAPAAIGQISRVEEGGDCLFGQAWIDCHGRRFRRIALRIAIPGFAGLR